MSYNYSMDMPFGASVTSPALEHAEQRLRQTERTVSKTQLELSTLMSVRSQTPMSQAESINKDREIHDLQARLHDHEQEVRQLRHLVEQQKVTIQQQSKAIQQPKQPYSTPSRRQHGSLQPGSLQGPNPTYPQAPAPLLGPRSGPAQQPSNAAPPAGLAYQPPTGPRNAPQFGQNTQQWNTPEYQPNAMLPPPPPQPQFRQHMTVNAFGSPEPRTQTMASGFQPISKHSSHSSLSNPASDPRRPMGVQGNQFTQSPQQPHPQQPHQQQQQPPYQQQSHLQHSQMNTMAVVPASLGEGVEQFKAAFEKVVNMCQQYAYAHVNTPSTIKDNQMPQAVKDRLLKAASVTTAFQFMSSPYTRFFLVTKIIVQWLMKNVLKHDCFRGLDLEVDNAIDALKASIYQSTPAQVKFQILNNIGQQMMKLRQRPDFDHFCQSISRQRGNEIWAIIKPMMHTKTSRDWDDLMLLMTEAHTAAAYMFSGSEEYRFEIPAAGVLYTPGPMVARDIHQNIKSNEQLVAERAQVRLSITPHVTVRKNSPGGLVSSATVIPASVLLKVGN